jgi:hypothetical protein
VHMLVTEGIARLENILEIVGCEVVVMGKRITSAFRRNYLG